MELMNEFVLIITLAVGVEIGVMMDSEFTSIDKDGAKVGTVVFT